MIRIPTARFARDLTCDQLTALQSTGRARIVSSAPVTVTCDGRRVPGFFVVWEVRA